MMIFHYWLENVQTKEVERVTTFDYLGDIDETINWKDNTCRIVDWAEDWEDWT